MTRWLTRSELDAWLALVPVMLRLSPALDSQLQRDSELTHFDYQCLAMLSEAPERTLRMSQLAGTVNASLSRLSHVVTKLQERGWVRRTPCPDSRRVTLVTLTDDGWAVLERAAPGHVEAVRALVFEGLSAEQVTALREISDTIRANIDRSGLRVEGR
ncbi:MAG TPA: MarR family transcriptional regulator [Nocardioidaceae bacterium]|jgi:DNA-binding MarR family transcriptional regulator|nr:MarR family transcriptional regulator [Nocardioidaceae bacterium]